MKDVKFVITRTNVWQTRAFEQTFRAAVTKVDVCIVPYDKATRGAAEADRRLRVPQ